nr:phytanoyl-CoA dioxygenase family protein [Mesorhizobium sp. IRAMC:0171]
MSQLRDAFERDGVIVLRGLLTAEAVLRMRAAAAELLDPLEPHSSGLTEKRGLWREHPVFREFVQFSAAPRLAAALMRSSSARFFFDRLAYKGPSGLFPIPWHRDQPHWPVAGKMVCTIGIALDPIRIETGGLEFQPGTHLKSAPQQTDAGSPAAVSWEMEPGDCHIYSSMLVHRMGASAAGDRRYSFVTRWLGEDASIDPRPGTDSSLFGCFLEATEPPDFAALEPDWGSLRLVSPRTN